MNRVFPDLDAVAVTTGRDNYPLSKVADSIFSAVKSDTALPPDSASAHLLANTILDISTEKPTRVGPTPKLAAIISGKVYKAGRTGNKDMHRSISRLMFELRLFCQASQVRLPMCA
jgi:hypothetical protein